MQVDYLIVGQGISGTLLSWFLHREGKSFLVIDEARPQSPSKVAAGIINPVTGRRYAYTWLIDEVMPFAHKTYEQIGDFLEVPLIAAKSIIDFFPSAQMRNAFVDRLAGNDTYLHSFPDQNHFNTDFHYDFGCGEVRPAYIVHLQELLRGWRQRLKDEQLLLEETLDPAALNLQGDTVRYDHMTAARIIFCDGAAGVGNPWFHLLPYAPNKGEALIIECPDLGRAHIFKKGLMLAPWAGAGLYWVGSNYQWTFDNDQPSTAFYHHATAVLNGWLRKPYRVLDHLASIRPATLERRPFVGFHPQEPRVGILNGMGTKGASLAPFFAHQLAQHLVAGIPLLAEADVRRFSRILSR